MFKMLVWKLLTTSMSKSSLKTFSVKMGVSAIYSTVYPLKHPQLPQSTQSVRVRQVKERIACDTCWSRGLAQTGRAAKGKSIKKGKRMVGFTVNASIEGSQCNAKDLFMHLFSGDWERKCDCMCTFLIIFCCQICVCCL